jgi:hypothetical protein
MCYIGSMVAGIIGFIVLGGAFILSLFLLGMVLNAISLFMGVVLMIADKVSVRFFNKTLF